MPFWLMFVPFVALARAIATLFVAFGQWITGNYFTLVPDDGGAPAHIEYIEPSRDHPDARIRISLSNGTTFIALLDSETPKSPIRVLAAEPGDTSVAPYGYGRALALHLTEESGGWLDCSFTIGDRHEPRAGRCVSDTGRGFEVVRNQRPSPRTRLGRHG